VTTIDIERHIHVPIAIAWLELADIAHHIDWMADAESIEFSTDQHRGLGTRFTCLTKVGPLRTRDQMEITSWEEGTSIGVRHRGLIKGEGVLSLRPDGTQDACYLSWKEELHFRAIVGGSITAYVAEPVLTKIWVQNLERFERCARQRLESNEP
jgi:hypothetical protein